MQGSSPSCADCVLMCDSGGRGRGGGRAWQGGRAALLGAPWTFWLIFLPLHNTAQILSFASINGEGEGAGRLGVSSGVAFISLSAGKFKGHPIQALPPHTHPHPPDCAAMT